MPRLMEIRKQHGFPQPFGKASQKTLCFTTFSTASTAGSHSTRFRPSLYADNSVLNFWEKSPVGRAHSTHDATWAYIEEHYKDIVTDVDLLIAPHHGRKSGRSYDFLDYVNPKLTLFGCAPAEHLAYGAWNYRDLTHITNNQCGCIVAEGSGGMDIYVENDSFAEKSGGDVNRKNSQGFYYLGAV